jgi:hypothetical protein
VVDLDYFKILATVSLAVIGWLIAHYFTSKRDLINKKREITIEHLISAYRILTNEIAHREPNETRSHALETILSDIQMFGSLEQISLAKELANEVAEGKVFELDPLINSLRTDLRNQLDLKPVEGNIQWLRFNG